MSSAERLYQPRRPSGRGDRRPGRVLLLGEPVERGGQEAHISASGRGLAGERCVEVGVPGRGRADQGRALARAGQGSPSSSPLRAHFTYTVRTSVAPASAPDADKLADNLEGRHGAAGSA